MKVMPSQISCGGKVARSSCGMPRCSVSAAKAGIATSRARAAANPRDIVIISLGQRIAPSARCSEHEEDKEGDGEAEEAGRLGEREAEERERRHLRRGVAGEGVD